MWCVEFRGNVGRLSGTLRCCLGSMFGFPESAGFLEATRFRVGFYRFQRPLLFFWGGVQIP